MTKGKLLFILALTLTLLSYQCSSDKGIVKQIPNGVLITSKAKNTKVVFYDQNMVRILKWTAEGTENKKSLSVIMDSLPAIQVKVNHSEDSVILSTERLKVRISLKDGRIAYFDLQDKELLSETSCELKPVVYKKDSAFNIKQSFNLSAEEGIYGLGQHQYGYMNYRGKTVKLVQTNTDAVNPFLVSTRGYGILWDNYSKTEYADDGKQTASLWSDVADNIDYYFIAGENMDQTIAGYRKLTGEAPMYGKWAYGYWQSKEHYKTQDEVMSIAKKYRQLKYPIDNIVQDWDYWNGAANWGSMLFDSTLFPKPDEMVKELHRMNYHMMLSIWPAVGPNTVMFKDMLQHGFLYSPVGWAGFKYYDAYNPQANKMYWEYLKKGLASKGIDAWWMDSTEPDVINALTKESEEYELKKMDNNYLGSFARYLNPFSLVMTGNVYNNWRKEMPGRRCYILTRSTFAGQQRYAATTWSGDIGANWDIYKNQISAGINHSMSGIPYWTFDIGSYVLGAYEGVFNKGGKDPAYQELYTRMFQLGTFTPIFRSHGSETPREIWEMGDFTKPILKFDNLRYRLLPYIYSLAWKVTNQGYTIMRGLPMDFTSDTKTYSINDQFMFGPALMVCPVTEFMYHRPPEKSIIVAPEFFKTKDGKQGLVAKYYKDNKYKNLGKETIDKNIDIFWYTGRPDYVSDSMFSVRWEGKLIPKESGKHQFHLKSFDAKRIFLDGKQLPIVYTSTEQYTDVVDLVAGKEYTFALETENSSTGAARMILCWKTPSVFAQEKSAVDRAKNRMVYLPQTAGWFDFWTGAKYEGAQIKKADAPIDIVPLYVKAGSIIPMGPFLQYATEKTADPIELRIYPGSDGNFVLYEDENENYNYEKGIYATIEFNWNDANHTLTIGKRKGSFPRMLNQRTFQIIMVSKDHGTGVEITKNPDKTIKYNGTECIVQL
jgi:alpha-D-xyloside xylohydrolase